MPPVKAKKTNRKAISRHCLSPTVPSIVSASWLLSICCLLRPTWWRKQYKRWELIKIIIHHTRKVNILFFFFFYTYHDMGKFGRRHTDDTFSPENKLTFHANIVSSTWGDNLHEMLKLIFWGKKKKHISKSLLKFLPSVLSVKSYRAPDTQKYLIAGTLVFTSSLTCLFII